MTEKIEGVPDSGSKIIGLTEPPDVNNEKYRVSGHSTTAILVVMTLLYTVNYMDRQVLSVVLEPMKNDLGLTDAQAGFLQTLFLLSIGVLAIPASILIDRWSRRKGVALMAVIWSLSTFATGLGARFFHVALARFFTGAGEAGFLSGGLAWLSLSFPSDKRSKVVGVFNLGIPLGSMLGVVLGGYIADKTGSWRIPFFIFALPGIILGLMTLTLKDYATVDREGSSKAWLLELMGLLRNRTFLLDTIGIGLWAFIQFGILAWIPALFIRTYGLTEAKAGLFAGIIGLMSIFGALLGGLLADAWQKTNPAGRMIFAMTANILGTIAAFIFIAGFNRSIVTAVVAGMIHGFMAVLSMPACQSVLQDVVEPKFRSASVGLNTVIMFLIGGAWGPLVIGALSDSLGGGHAGLRYALMFCTAAGFFSALFLFLGARHYPGDSEKVNDDVMAERLE